VKHLQEEAKKKDPQPVKESGNPEESKKEGKSEKEISQKKVKEVKNT